MAHTADAGMVVLGDQAAGHHLLVGHHLAAAQDQEVKDALLAETQRAVERGTFGSPTFFVDDEIYFGKDRLHDVEEAIARKK